MRVSVEQWLAGERVAEERGFRRGRQSVRALLLKCAIRRDTFPGPDATATRYRCFECGAVWDGPSDAHPITGTCPVEAILIEPMEAASGHQ